MVSKYCVYSNTDGHLFYFIFFCVQSPTIISVAIDILVHVLLHKVILVPKHSKRISVLIDVPQFFSKKTRAIHTSTSNTKFSPFPLSNQSHHTFIFLPVQGIEHNIMLLLKSTFF